MSLPAESYDFIAVGSGAAALVAALVASAGGLSVIILEKTDRIGGTSAMSGAGTWIPANHVARAAGISDSAEETLAYLRSAAPDGWADKEEPLWRAFVTHAPRMLEFVEQHTPLRFELIDEPDPFAERAGGKHNGRMVSPRALSRRQIGRHARALRRSTLPHIFTYREMHRYDPYHAPVSAGLRLLPRLAWRWLTDRRGQGNALITGLLKGCIDHGCRLELQAPVRRLIHDRPGRVTGVELGGRTIEARRGVLLATGGFEWDEALCARNFPGPLDRIGSPRSNTGDGQRMAAEVGAQLDRMDQANVYPTIPTVYEGRLHGLPITFQAEPHAIVVDRHGVRFVSEYQLQHRRSARPPRSRRLAAAPARLARRRPSVPSPVAAAACIRTPPAGLAAARRQHPGTCPRHRCTGSGARRHRRTLQRLLCRRP